MTDQPKLTKRHAEGLLEIERMTRHGGRYFWRHVTMRELAAHGYVKEVGKREFRLTEAGRARAKTLEGG